MAYTIIKTEAAFVNFLNKIDGPVSFDTETTGLGIDANLLGISMYNPYSGKAFIPVDTYFEGCMNILQIRKIAEKIFPTLTGLGHNIKFDLCVFRANQLPDIKLVADTMLMAHIYDPDTEKQLEKQMKKVFGETKQTFEEIIGKKWEKVDWSKDVTSGEITLEQLAEYACDDAEGTYRLWQHYLPLLQKEALIDVHDKIELPLVYVLRDMFITGVKVDCEVLYKMGVEIDSRIETLTEDIYTEAGCVFNLNSPKQKAEVLFDKLHLPLVKETKTGGRSTDSDTLEFLANAGHQICEYMVEYSTLQKLNSGYVKAIPNLVDIDGQLRCSFNSAGTKTGRFSANNPNLQNQPNNSDFPVRKCFVARPGRKLIVFDYSQVELRVMAHVSKDERFMKAFFEGRDIHQLVADDLKITRKQAKVVNFGILYGMGYTKLANAIGVPDKRAKEVINGYETTYTGYYNWKVQTERIAERTQAVKNLFGRIRRLPHVTSESRAFHFAALRQACNTAIQGGAADIIKRAMIEIHKELKLANLNTDLLLQVHDELVFEADEHQVEQSYVLIKQFMEETTKLRVPLIADGKVCESWFQMKDDNFHSLLPNYKNQFPIWAIL